MEAVWCRCHPEEPSARTGRSHPPNEPRGSRAMHPADHLAVTGLPHHQGGGWSLVPARLHSSLGAAAPGVRHRQQDENVANNVF